MAQILRFGKAVAHDVRREPRADLKVVRSQRPVEEPDEFWLEVSRGLWSDQPIPVNPANSAERVLTEMLMVLCGAGFLVLLAIFFFGTPPV